MGTVVNVSAMKQLLSYVLASVDFPLVNYLFCISEKYISCVGNALPTSASTVHFLIILSCFKVKRYAVNVDSIL